jgi:hypothetical protein
MNHAMMAKSSAESVYFTLVPGSRHVDGNSAVAKLKNEYDSVSIDSFALLLTRVVRVARPTRGDARERRARPASSRPRGNDAMHIDIAGDIDNVEDMILGVRARAPTQRRVARASYSAAFAVEEASLLSPRPRRFSVETFFVHSSSRLTVDRGTRCARRHHGAFIGVSHDGEERPVRARSVANFASRSSQR